MEKQSEQLSLQDYEVDNFKLHQNEYHELINFFRHNSEKYFATNEILYRIPVLKKWSEADLMRNIYRLESFKVLTIESNSNNPILRYNIQVNEKLAESLFKLTDNTFKIDFEFTQLQYLEFIKDIEKDCYDKEYEALVAYWENEKLKFILPNERLSELIKLRDYYKEAYFSKSNVLQYYCVHNKEELSEKLAKFGKYEKLIAHPADLFKDFKSPKEVLEFVIYFRFKQLLQFETLNYLIECEKELPNERFEDFKNGIAREYCDTLIYFFKNENPI
jgi:hypothetical protein